MPRLLLLASVRLARAGLPQSDTDDIVTEAISKTIGGIRVWRREQCTLFQHLAGVIVSDISHRAGAPERRFLQDPTHASNSHTNWPPEVVDDAPSQEEVAVWTAEQRRLLNYLRAIDPVLGRMAELILVDHLYETHDLAPGLGLTAPQVANLRKRLKRAVQRYQEEDQS